MLIQIDTGLLCDKKINAHQYILAFLLKENISELVRYTSNNPATEHDICALINAGFATDQRDKDDTTIN